MTFYERVCWRVAMRLPRKVIFFALCRALNYACMGSTGIDPLASEVIEAWELQR